MIYSPATVVRVNLEAGKACFTLLHVLLQHPAVVFRYSLRSKDQPEIESNARGVSFGEEQMCFQASCKFTAFGAQTLMS